MKNIGLVTLFRDNYGSILQCYATKFLITKMGYNCEVLTTYRKPFYTKICKPYNLMKLVCRSIRYRGYFRQWKKMRSAMKLEKKFLSHESKKQMDMFINSELRPISCNSHLLKEMGTNADYIAFITGSDQVWNASRTVEPLYFLNFVPKQKRIAWAPSFGVADIPEFNFNSIKKGISGFNKLSVREERGRTIIKELINRDAIRISDPVMLLDSIDWRNFEDDSDFPEHGYIFAHFLNSPSQVAIKSLNYLSKYYQCPVICFAYQYNDYIHLKEYTFVNGGPKKYVALIDHANAICTDSFHTTLFSIIFGKKFFTFNREYIHGYPQTSRIYDLLNRFKISDRLIKYKEDVEKLVSKEIPNLDEILKQERFITYTYLFNEINHKLKEG